MFFDFGTPVAPGTTEALPPKKTEINRLLEIAPQYGVEVRLPPH
jgi:hypothetical protein